MSDDRAPGFYWVLTNGDDGLPLGTSTPEPAEWGDDGQWYGVGCEMPMPASFFTPISNRLTPPPVDPREERSWTWSVRPILFEAALDSRNGLRVGLVIVDLGTTATALDVRAAGVKALELALEAVRAVKGGPK